MAHLDASKMNRGIYLAVPNHDLQDCIETSIEIANSYRENLGKEHYYSFELLSKSYIEFVKDTLLLEHGDFHGARDFYHVVKLMSRKFWRI